MTCKLRDYHGRIVSRIHDNRKPVPSAACCRKCGSRRYRITVDGRGRFAAVCGRGHLSVVYFRRLLAAGVIYQEGPR